MFNGMMMSGAKSAVPPPDPDVLTLTGGSFSATNRNENAEIFIKFDADGNVYRKKITPLPNPVYVQIATSTDWVRPTTSSPGLYQIRFTAATGDTTYVSSTTAEDVWHDLSIGDFIISIFDSSPAEGGKSATFTIEIREDGGDVIASGEYTITADRDDLD